MSTVFHLSVGLLNFFWCGISVNSQNIIQRSPLVSEIRIYNFKHFSDLKCHCNQISNIQFFYIFIHNWSFPRYCSKCQPITNIRTHVFLDLYFQKFTAAINFSCSKSRLRITENDTIFSKIQHGLKS